MREIKFRAWDIKKKALLPVVNFGFWTSVSPPNDDEEGNETYELRSELYPDGSGAVECEVMQYTGLKDKNGVEIYEGDIVRVNKWPDEEYENRIVTYDAPSFWLAKRIEDKVDVDLFSTPGAYEEVIGNIYENSNLLGRKDAQ